MYAFIAPVSDQRASTKPMIVAAMLDPGCASARSSDRSSSEVACDGMNELKCWIRLVIVSGPAISVNRPSTTSRTDGIAKNVLYASADASIIALLSRNFFPALITIAFQSAKVRSRNPRSSTRGSCRSGCGPGVTSSSGASSGTGRAVSRFARRAIDSATPEPPLEVRAMV